MTFPQSVKFRLTLGYAFVLAVLLFVFSFFMRAELAQVLYQDADVKLFYEATLLEESLKNYSKGPFKVVL